MFDASAGRASPAAGTILEGMFTPDFKAAWDASSPKAPKGSLDNGGAAFPRQEETPSETEGLRERLSKKKLKGKPEPKQKEIRGASRWRMKAKVRHLLKPEDGTRGPSVCGCGSPGFEVEAVSLHRRANGAGGASGVFKCDSPWLCPTCAVGRAKRRRERLVEVIEATKNSGGHTAFVTLTIGHDLSLSLPEAKRIVSESSRRSRQGRDWMKIKADGQLLGVVQGVEVLHNVVTGWHYHLHLLVVGLGSGEAVLAAAQKLIARYLEQVKLQGGYALNEGQDAQLVNVEDREEVGRYASKGSASWEVAGGAKEARSGYSRTPWDLVTLATMGDEDAKRLFLEYASVMPGTRSCVVSATLAKALQIEVQEDGDEPGVQQLEDGDEVLGTIPAPIWSRVWGRGKSWMVLKAIERRFPWERVDELARRLGAELPPPPKPTNWVDIKRVVQAARARGGTNAHKSMFIEAAIAEQKAEAARKGRPFKITERDRWAIDMEFIRQGLDAPL